MKIWLELISPIIAVVAFLLSAYNFMDNFVFEFKPAIRLVRILFFIFDPKKKIGLRRTKLDSILCKIEIYNHRNRLGQIDNFMIGVFDSNELNPVIHNVFPKWEIDELPSSETGVMGVKKKPFCPKTILHKSSKELSLEFSDDVICSIFLRPNSSLNFYLYYTTTGEKWIRIGEYSLNSSLSTPEKIGDRDIYMFSILESQPENKLLQMAPKTGVSDQYSGMAEFYISWWVRKPYYLILSKFNRLVDASKLVRDFFGACFRYIYSEVVINLVLRLIGTKRIIPHFNSGSSKRSNITDATLRSMRENFVKKLVSINAKCDENGGISLIDCANGFRLRRFHNTIGIYKSGDGSITVQQISLAETGEQIIYSARLTEYVFGIMLWKINDSETVFANSLCTRILDYFAFHSNNPMH